MFTVIILNAACLYGIIMVNKYHRADKLRSELQDLQDSFHFYKKSCNRQSSRVEGCYDELLQLKTDITETIGQYKSCMVQYNSCRKREINMLKLFPLEIEVNCGKTTK